MVRPGMPQIPEALPVSEAAFVERLLALPRAGVPVEDAEQPALQRGRGTDGVLHVREASVVDEEALSLAGIAPAGARERMAAADAGPPLLEEGSCLGRSAADLFLCVRTRLAAERSERHLVPRLHRAAQRPGGQHASTRVGGVHLANHGQGGREAGDAGWQRRAPSRAEAETALSRPECGLPAVVAEPPRQRSSAPRRS